MAIQAFIFGTMHNLANIILLARFTLQAVIINKKADVTICN